MLYMNLYVQQFFFTVLCVCVIAVHGPTYFDPLVKLGISFLVYDCFLLCFRQTVCYSRW